MLQKALAHIDAKRDALKLVPYDRSRWECSGDWRTHELEDLPLAWRLRALYGTLATQEEEIYDEAIAG